MSSGIVIPILRYTAINWSSVTGATEDLVIVDRVPVAPFTKIGLSARLHKTRLATNTTMQFIVRGINPSDEDSQDFVWGTDLGSTAQITTSTTAPRVEQLTTIISDVQQPMIRVILRTIIGAASGVNIAWWSADLVVRTGG